MVFHVVGGNIFLKFFLGDSNPENVIKSYHRFINGFGLHPFWA
jgi:alpha-glucosidase